MMTPAPANLAYFLEVSAENYYGIQNEPDGYWLGRGASQLGLLGTADEKQISNLAAGLFPDGSASMVQQQNYSSRTRQPGWDLTFNAPKSVSIAFAIADESTRLQIQQAHTAAIQNAFRYLEEHGALTRRKIDGEVSFERAKLVAVAFEHASSRNLDPHLHTHLVVLNVALRDDQTTGTVYSRPFWNLQKTAGAIYRATLAQELVERGVDDLRKGKHSFELSSISDSQTKRWSTRSTEIREAEKKLEQTSPKTRDIIAYQTRREKESISREELFEKWKERAMSDGIAPCLANSLPLSPEQTKIFAQNAVSFAIDKLETRQSYFSHNMVIELALSQTEHLGISVDTVLNEIQSAIVDKRLVGLGTYKEKSFLSTPMILQTESELIQLAQESSSRLAVRRVNSTEVDQAVEGFVADAAKRASKLIGITITPKAAAEFAAQSSIETSTVAGLLYHQVLEPNSTLIVKSPSSLSTQQLRDLIEFTSKNQSQIVFLDSSKQLTSFGPKGGFDLVRKTVAAEQLTLEDMQESFSVKELSIQHCSNLETAVSILATRLIEQSSQIEFVPAAVSSREIALLMNDLCQRERLKQLTSTPNVYASLGSGEKAYVGDQISFLRNLANDGIQSGLQAEITQLDPATNSVWIRSQNDTLHVPYTALSWASLSYATTNYQIREMERPVSFLLIDQANDQKVSLPVDANTQVITYHSQNKDPEIDSDLKKLLESRLSIMDWQPKSATQMQIELQQQGI